MWEGCWAEWRRGFGGWKRGEKKLIPLTTTESKWKHTYCHTKSIFIWLENNRRDSQYISFHGVLVCSVCQRVWVKITNAHTHMLTSTEKLKLSNRSSSSHSHTNWIIFVSDLQMPVFTQMLTFSILFEMKVVGYKGCVCVCVIVYMWFACVCLVCTYTRPSSTCMEQ